MHHLQIGGSFPTFPFLAEMHVLSNIQYELCFELIWQESICQEHKCKQCVNLKHNYQEIEG